MKSSEIWAVLFICYINNFCIKGTSNKSSNLSDIRYLWLFGLQWLFFPPNHNNEFAKRFIFLWFKQGIDASRVMSQFLVANVCKP